MNKLLTDEELFVKLISSLPNEDIEKLYYTSIQNIIPDTHEAFKDLINELKITDIQRTTLFKRTRIYPKFIFDPDDKLDVIFRCAESAYKRMNDIVYYVFNSNYKLKIHNIYRIDYIENKKNIEIFQETKKNFLKNGIPSDERYMFHGTNICNINSIIQKNFDKDFYSVHKFKKSVFGKGIYFSDFPHIGLCYGRTLLLCRVLTGRIKKTNNHVNSNDDIQNQNEYDSKSVNIKIHNKIEYSEIRVIKNSNQILPHCIIFLQEIDEYKNNNLWSLQNIITKKIITNLFVTFDERRFFKEALTNQNNDSNIYIDNIVKYITKFEIYHNLQLNLFSENFIQFYYSHLDDVKQRHKIFELYNEDSLLTFQGSQNYGVNNIIEQIKGIHICKQHLINTVNYQSINDNDILINITGNVLLIINKYVFFSHIFILNTKNFIIKHEIYRS